VSLSVHIGSYVYKARFTIYDVKGFVIVRVLGKRWMRDINGRYHIDHYKGTPLLRQHQFTTYVVLVAEPTGLFLRSRDWTRSWVNDRESVLHCSDVEFHEDVNCHISCPTMIDDGIDPFGLPTREPIHANTRILRVRTNRRKLERQNTVNY
jgi:hypothetical protein